MEDRTVYAGLVGVGLNTYWPQFSGLYERLCGYRKQIAKQLEQEHVCVVDGVSCYRFTLHPFNKKRESNGKERNQSSQIQY